MRALYFAKPLEFQLEVAGDDFIQGKPLSGTLSVTNRGNEAQDNLNLEIGLAYGAFREIKEMGNKALNLLDRNLLAKGFSLKPGAANKAEWELPLGHDAPIMSADGAPFLVYGANLDVIETRGQIDLPVELSQPAATFITTLENHFAFEARARSCVGGVVEVRLKPPGSYPTLDELTVLMKIDPKTVELEFRGKGKRLRGGEAGGTTTKKNSTRQSVPGAQFGVGGGLPNRALYKELIDTMLPKIAVRRENPSRF